MINVVTSVQMRIRPHLVLSWSGMGRKLAIEEKKIEVVLVSASRWWRGRRRHRRDYTAVSFMISLGLTNKVNEQK